MSIKTMYGLLFLGFISISYSIPIKKKSQGTELNNYCSPFLSSLLSYGDKCSSNIYTLLLSFSCDHCRDIFLTLPSIENDIFQNKVHLKISFGSFMPLDPLIYIGIRKINAQERCNVLYQFYEEQENIFCFDKNDCLKMKESIDKVIIFFQKFGVNLRDVFEFNDNTILYKVPYKKIEQEIIQNSMHAVSSDNNGKKYIAYPVIIKGKMKKPINSFKELKDLLIL